MKSIKRLNLLVKTLNGVKGNFYWVKAVKRIYKLSNGETGYLVAKLNGVI